MSFMMLRRSFQELLCNRRNPAWLESLGSSIVDFKKQLSGKKSFAKLKDPIEIYETLDGASDKGRRSDISYGA